MSAPITLRAARIIGPMQLSIDWSTGETLSVNLTALATPPFDAWQSPAFFAQMQLEAWGGHGLDWPGGLSLDADRLYALCREQAVSPAARAFDAWMQRNRLSLTAAAQALGMTRRSITAYRTGNRPVPRTVALACKGWEVEQQMQH